MIGPFGHLIEERIHGIAARAPLAREVPDCGRTSQAIEHHDPVRHSIESPNAVLKVRARFGEKEALREVGAACELELAGLILLGVRG